MGLEIDSQNWSLLDWITESYKIE